MQAGDPRWPARKQLQLWQPNEQNNGDSAIDFGDVLQSVQKIHNKHACICIPAKFLPQ